MTEALLLSIEQACNLLGVRKTKLYSEAKAGRLRLLKVGRRSVLKREDAEAWVAALPVASFRGQSASPLTGSDQ